MVNSLREGETARTTTIAVIITDTVEEWAAATTTVVEASSIVTHRKISHLKVAAATTMDKAAVTCVDKAAIDNLMIVSAATVMEPVEEAMKEMVTITTEDRMTNGKAVTEGRAATTDRTTHILMQITRVLVPTHRTNLDRTQATISRSSERIATCVSAMMKVNRPTIGIVTMGPIVDTDAMNTLEVPEGVPPPTLPTKAATKATTSTSPQLLVPRPREVIAAQILTTKAELVALTALEAWAAITTVEVVPQPVTTG